MLLMKIRNVKKSFGDRDILTGINLDIALGDRIGLAGYNGTGKTTFAKLLAGILSMDEGYIDVFGKKVKIGYLQQSVDYTDDSLKVQHHSKEWLKSAKMLGIGSLEDHRERRHLSGGEKLKVALTNVLQGNPDLLILDEPTNHMDLRGIKWLTSELQRFSGTVLIISHDRYFLDQTVTRIEELHDGKLISYEGNYSDYRKEKQRRFEIQERDYEKQQRYKKRIEGQMENLKSWSEKAHRDSTKSKTNEKLPMGYKETQRVKAKKMDIQIRSKMKRLNAEMEKNKVEKPKEDTSVYFDFNASQKRGKRILEATNAAKAFGSRTLFHQSHFYMKHGEKAALLGPNGSGKTTFLNILLGKEELSEGEIWFSHSLKIGYLSQEVEDLNVNLTPIQALGLTDRDTKSRAMDISAHLGLSEMMDRKIEELSLGQRTRVKLIGLLLQELDMLILDEPTNHLDLPSREQLEETLSLFSGTLLIVSHDYYFLEKLADSMLVIEEDQVIRKYGMTLKEWEKKDSVTEPKDDKEKLLILETELSAVLGKLSLLQPGDPEYTELDNSFKQLMSRKKELNNG
ncbi:ABC-F family ATP-binding cassette domain-containing protein [Metabacillus sp. KIGAM252]|uniref:ABC-F family ATP-binding cassette domain-containing protein n=1 Tax=Metabacillus flavus TaxID=2823519 RepID=A0ABS5LDM8_9BACI|nr:ABC-F family ATP-binding cassette domain-containing protein [Metabacillus flavus]MBS2968699.1 ABC-F family ATP-binding cassette domain-containing protein [Metabacillus flavus]